MQSGTGGARRVLPGGSRDREPGLLPRPRCQRAKWRGEAFANATAWPDRAAGSCGSSHDPSQKETEMRVPTSRCVLFSITVLTAVLAVPGAAAAAPPAGVAAVLTVASVSPLQLASQVWGWLRGSWIGGGCIGDPNGVHCAGSALRPSPVRPSEGCIGDPNGGRCMGSAARPAGGCIADPSGQHCAATPAASWRRISPITGRR
jgi:hypothetical protein